jgi:hypothetical protein
MITMGSPDFVWINTNETISSWYLLDAVCVPPPPPSAPRTRRTAGPGGGGGRSECAGRASSRATANCPLPSQSSPGVVTPAQPGGPTTGNFHQIAWRSNGKWVGILCNREAKGAGRPPWPPSVSIPGPRSGWSAAAASRAGRIPVRAGNRQFGPLSALRSHTQVPYKTNLLWGTLWALNRPERARTVQCRPDHTELPVPPHWKQRSLNGGTARAGNRRFGPSSALRAHTKAPYKMDFNRKTLTALNRPGTARTVALADWLLRVKVAVAAGAWPPRVTPGRSRPSQPGGSSG